MSTHPNVMLQCVLTVDGGTRKTLRALLDEFSGEGCYEGRINIDGEHYTATVMESDYDDDYQISAEEGQIVLHEYLTYEYGETVGFDEVCARVTALKQWADAAKEKHQFTYAVRLGANYW